MSEKIKEAINHFKEAVDSKKAPIMFDYTIATKDVELLLKYLTNLQQKVEQLEKENKELNRMCELYGQSLYNADLTKAEKRVEQLENIRKEVREYCRSNEWAKDYENSNCRTHLLNILNKGSESNE